MVAYKLTLILDPVVLRSIEEYQKMLFESEAFECLNAEM